MVATNLRKARQSEAVDEGGFAKRRNSSMAERWNINLSGHRFGKCLIADAHIIFGGIETSGQKRKLDGSSNGATAAKCPSCCFPTFDDQNLPFSILRIKGFQRRRLKQGEPICAACRVSWQRDKQIFEESKRLEEGGGATRQSARRTSQRGRGLVGSGDQQGDPESEAPWHLGQQTNHFSHPRRSA